MGLSKCLENLLGFADGENEAQRDAGPVRRPQQRKQKVPGAPPPPLLAEEEAPSFLPGEFHWAVSETRPISFPFPLVDNGSLYFLPSFPQPPPHTAVVPERVGNTSHTTETLWTLGQPLPTGQRKGSCQGVTSGMSSIPQPYPTHLGELEGSFQFLDGDPEARRACRSVQVTTSVFWGTNTPSLEPSSLEMVTQKIKG